MAYIDLLNILSYSVEIEQTSEDTPNLISNVFITVQTAQGEKTVHLEDIDLDTATDDITKPLYDAYSTIGDEENEDEIDERGFEDAYQDLLELCLKNWLDEGIEDNSLFWNPNTDELEVFGDSDHLELVTEITEVNVAIHDGSISHCEVYVAAQDGNTYCIREDSLQQMLPKHPEEYIIPALDDHITEEREELDLQNAGELEDDIKSVITELIDAQELYMNTYAGLAVVIA